MKKILLVLLVLCSFVGTNAQTRFEPQLTINYGFYAPRDGDDMQMDYLVDMIAGFRLNDYFRIGAGTGYEISKFEFNTHRAYGTGNAYAIPALIDFKINMNSSFVSPFINVNGGYSFAISSDEYLDVESGYRATAIIGVDIQHIVVGAHYTVRDWGYGEPNQAIGISCGFVF